MSYHIRAVHSELTALKDLGVRVPDKAFDVATREADHCHDCGMRISEITDYVIELAQIETK